jgi:hypothetical protein
MPKTTDQAADAPRPFYYRNDLIDAAIKAEGSIRTTAAASDLSIRTLQMLAAGEPVNQKTMRQAADYFGLDWTSLHTPKN